MKKIIYKNTKLVLISTLFMVSLLIFQSINIKAKTFNSPQNNLSLQQIKAQIHLFDKALNEFGATSPKQAVDIWVKGFKDRNGVMQYSVLCDNLRKDWIRKMGDPTNSFWIIGGSHLLWHHTMVQNTLQLVLFLLYLSIMAILNLM